MEQWIDVHTHRPGRGICVLDPCVGAEEVLEGSKIYYSMGIHPWFVDKNWKVKLATIEKAASNSWIVAIGEAGLDRNSSVSWSEQMDCFERQTEIAARYDMPLIVHAVRATPDVITICNHYGVSHQAILHGFNQRKEVLYDLLRHGFSISVGSHLLNQQSHAWKLLPEIPEERLLLETDDSEYLIDTIYQAAANRLEMDSMVLLKRIRMNFERLFKIRNDV